MTSLSQCINIGDIGFGHNKISYNKSLSHSTYLPFTCTVKDFSYVQEIAFFFKHTSVEEKFIIANMSSCTQINTPSPISLYNIDFINYCL